MGSMSYGRIEVARTHRARQSVIGLVIGLVMGHEGPALFKLFLSTTRHGFGLWIDLAETDFRLAKISTLLSFT